MTQNSKLTVEKLMENLQARDAMDNERQAPCRFEELAAENAVLKRLLVDALLKNKHMKDLLDTGTSVEQGCHGRGHDAVYGDPVDDLFRELLIATVI